MIEMSKPENVDTYIANSSKESQQKLEEIRKLIKTTIPEVEEKIWYGVPFYNYHGEFVGFAAYKNHVSFGFGNDVLQNEDREILEKQGYKTGKGTIQIKYDQEIPITIIKKILKTKARMNKAKEMTK